MNAKERCRVGNLSRARRCLRIIAQAMATLAFAFGLSDRDLHAADGPRKVALLVGINKYQKRSFPDLTWAERDMGALEQQLKGLGFTTVLLTGSAQGKLQATRENIDRELLALLKGIGKEDVVLLGLSGHGQEFPVKRAGKQVEESFFCPYDAVEGEAETLLGFNYLLDDVLARKGGRNLVLVDACRDVRKDKNRGAKGIQGRVITLPEDTAVLFSCKAGQQSWENDDLQHGLFTYCILDGLKTLATKDKKVSWSALQDHVLAKMTSPEIARKMPRQQTPIPAGGVPYTELGKVRHATPAEILDKAIALSISMHVTPGKRTGQLAIVDALVHIRTLDAAEKFARSMANPEDKSTALAKIAIALAKNGATDQARGMLSEARDIALTLKSAALETPHATVSEAMALTGNLDEGLRVARSSLYSRVTALCAVADVQIKQDRKDLAKPILDEAMANAKDKFLISSIATYQADAALHDDVRKSCDKILAAYGGNDDEYGEGKLQVAYILAYAGLASEAIEMARSVPPRTSNKHQALHYVVQGLVRAGKLPQAQEALKLAEDENYRKLRLNSGELYRSLALCEIAQAQFRVGQKAEARETINTAARLVRSALAEWGKEDYTIRHISRGVDRVARVQVVIGQFTDALRMAALLDNQKLFERAGTYVGMAADASRMDVVTDEIKLWARTVALVSWAEEIKKRDQNLLDSERDFARGAARLDCLDEALAVVNELPPSYIRIRLYCELAAGLFDVEHGLDLPETNRP
jgi:tetratricopeptide (TPR) repeat protein